MSEDLGPYLKSWTVFFDLIDEEITRIKMTDTTITTTTTGSTVPVSTAAATVKAPTPKQPIFYNLDKNGNPIPVYSQLNYDVFVAAKDATEFPMYVVINRDTSVLEFTHEVTEFYKEWLNQFAKVPSASAASTTTAN